MDQYIDGSKELSHTYIIRSLFFLFLLDQKIAGSKDLSHFNDLQTLNDCHPDLAVLSLLLSWIAALSFNSNA